MRNSKNVFNGRLTTLHDCRIIPFPKIQNRKGNITPLQGLVDIPFRIRRVFYIYDIPGGAERGGHARKRCHELIIAASGSFLVTVSDGKDSKDLELNRSYYGVHLPPGLWAAETGFSSGAVCLVLASHPYRSDDYLRDYDQFLKYKSNRTGSISKC